MDVTISGQANTQDCWMPPVCVLLLYDAFFSENFCYTYVFVRRFMISEILVLVNMLSFIRYLFIFYLKNPAAFQDEFWHLFVNLWLGCANIVVQCSTILLNFKTMSTFLSCCRKNYDEDRTQNLSFFITVQIISAAVHAFMYCRIWWFKQKSKVVNIANCPKHKIMFLADLDKEAIWDITQSFGYMIFGGSISSNSTNDAKRKKTTPWLLPHLWLTFQ